MALRVMGEEKLDKMKTASFVFIICLISIAGSQDLDVTLANQKQLVAASRNTIVPVYGRDSSNKDYPQGSGFLCEKNKAILAITCAHVIRAITSHKFQLYIGLQTEVGFEKYLCNVRYIDTVNDIAIISPIRPKNKIVAVKSLVIDTTAISPDSAIIEGTPILAGGFPFGYGLEYDKYNPIFTFGYIAQRKSDSVFVADLTVNHGNSGGPVFDVENRKLIGVVSGYYNNNIQPESNSGSVVNPIPTNSGLANIISIGVVRRALQRLKM